MALVQRPLAAVLAAPDVRRPRDLAGRRAGVSGPARATRRSCGRSCAATAATPTRVREVTIGFQAVPALLVGRVAAATGFWNAEGVALRAPAPGDPRVPRRRLRRAVVPRARARHDARDAARATAPSCAGAVAALRRGYEGGAAGSGRRADGARPAVRPGVDRAAARSASSRPSRPPSRPRAGAFGELDPATLSAWADWEQRFGIVRTRPDVARLFAPGVAGTRRLNALSRNCSRRRQVAGTMMIKSSLLVAAVAVLPRPATALAAGPQPPDCPLYGAPARGRTTPDASRRRTCRGSRPVRRRCFRATGSSSRSACSVAGGGSGAVWHR